MPERFVMFTVVCPECRNEELAALPIGVVASALMTRNPVSLFANCHDIHWNATPKELDRLRVALAGMPVEAESKSSSTQNPGIRRTKAPSQLTAPR